MSGCTKFIILSAVLSFLLLIPPSASAAGESFLWSGQSALKPSPVIAIDSQNPEQKSPDPGNQTNPPSAEGPLNGNAASNPNGADPANAEKTEEEQKLQADQDIMETALELLDESQNFWVKGDLEKALDLLDQAYSLILDTNGEPDISRQKDDLRLIIAKRILAIYTSMQSVTAGKRGEIPIVMNSAVEKEIRLFQTMERDFFIQSYQRSGLYRPTMLRELKSAGLPEELSWLPLVESGFKIQALSRARALGLWQFIPSTGYKYGLNRDEWVDERMDVEKSTKAAIGYMKELHNMFGDWLTVLAAYNCGEGRVLKEISRQHINYLDRFWDLYEKLPYETARYVPRFLATIHIIRDPEKYGFELDRNIEMSSGPLAYDVVKTSKTMRLAEIAQRIEAPEETLNILNAELRHKVTPNREYPLKVPPETVEKLVSVVDEIPEWQPPRPAPTAKRMYTRHRVKRGETIASIARKYGTSSRNIRALNRSSLKRGLKAGQRLTVPVRGSRLAKANASSQWGTSNRGSYDTIKYRVKKGDTLNLLAQRFDMTVADIKDLNRLKKNTIYTGQTLKVARKTNDNKHRGTGKRAAQKQKAGESKNYRVKKGDTLYKIAMRNNIDVSRLMELNGLESKIIKPGQIIVVE
ncbi:MAG: LysM peptidoglycan-binding domain-containing protein [Deltaproteobacteria bacterium]|nr:LysM peptidoglycan-binding domain-containing protein [Deltaproteobacteria bacterium]